MKVSNEGRQIYGDAKALAKCRQDEKFANVVALARAVNALNSAHSLMNFTAGSTTPAAFRDRMNSHFFVTGILYETLKLIRAMVRVFKDDPSFENSLRLILKDPAAQALEQMHLKARNDGIFHFLPEKFAEAIAKTPMTECVFANSTADEKKSSLHYDFADTIVAEMVVGGPINNAAVVNKMFESTLDLVKKISDHSENFIADQLHVWGFVVRRAPAVVSSKAPSRSTAMPSK